LDLWQRDGRFLAFIRSKWQNYEGYDEGLYILKEKLKRLKLDLEIWNKEVFKNVNQTGEILQKKIQELDAGVDEDDLD